MNYDRDTAADELADLRSEARWQRQRHSRLMQLPPGHPDEPEDDTEVEDDEQ
jgi:hypothetical protein